jgi:hypothetical protein
MEGEVRKSRSKLMRNVIIFLFAINVLLPCAAEETITISKVYLERKGISENGKLIVDEKIVKENLPINSEQLVLHFPLHVEVDRVEGIEKLKNIKRLLIGNGLYNYFFLEKLEKLEVLIFENPSLTIDPEVFKKLPKLKIMYANDMEISKEELDFQSNKYLEYLYLGNIISKKRNGLFDLSVKNIPESLKYIDLTSSDLVIIDNNFLDSLKSVDYVLLYKPPYFDLFGPLRVDGGYLEKHQNIKLYEGKKGDKAESEYSKWIAKIVPEKYQRKQVYALFGLDEYGRSLSTGKY